MWNTFCVGQGQNPPSRGLRFDPVLRVALVSRDDADTSGCVRRSLTYTVLMPATLSHPNLTRLKVPRGSGLVGPFNLPVDCCVGMVTGPSQATVTSRPTR